MNRINNSIIMKKFRDESLKIADELDKLSNRIKSYVNCYDEIWKNGTTYLSWIPKEIFEYILQIAKKNKDEYNEYDIWLNRITEINELVNKKEAIRLDIPPDTLCYVFVSYNSVNFSEYYTSILYSLDKDKIYEFERYFEKIRLNFALTYRYEIKTIMIKDAYHKNYISFKFNMEVYGYWKNDYECKYLGMNIDIIDDIFKK